MNKYCTLQKINEKYLIFVKLCFICEAARKDVFVSSHFCVLKSNIFYIKMEKFVKTYELREKIVRI